MYQQNVFREVFKDVCKRVIRFRKVFKNKGPEGIKRTGLRREEKEKHEKEHGGGHGRKLH